MRTGESVSHYKILEKLGGGAMGEVFLAQDIDLPRKVALKSLLPESFSNQEAVARFRQEAHSLATLNHPNVVVIYELFEFEKRLFIAMEYVEGKTLRAIISERLLSIPEAVDFAIQIGEGLLRAQRAVVVHRDVKPENVLVDRENRIKLVDFGLAKLKGAAKITRSGSAAGTPAYMSPEQARGEDVDHRTDIFSFGAVLYEMIAGRPAFESQYLEEAIYSILYEQPVPLDRISRQIPAKLQEIVEKALSKEREKRFQGFDEILAELNALKKSREQENRKNGAPNLPEGGLKSVAVLYFENFNSDPESDYFSKGMTEDIITDLSNVEKFNVLSRHAVSPYEGRVVDIPTLGQKLGVEAILSGSVRKLGNRLRVSAQLIDVRAGFVLWAEAYDREWKEVFDLQVEIAQEIAYALKVELSEKEKKKMAEKYRGSPDAYEYYLKGRKHLDKQTHPDLRTAIRLFNDALEIDPDYELAYAGLSDCYIQIIDRNYDSDITNLDKAEQAAQQALQINAKSAEAWKALGLVSYKRGRYQEAGERLLKALELNSDYAAAHADLGVVYTHLGDFEKAERELLAAYHHDPYFNEAAFIPLALSRFYLSLNRYSEAERYIRLVSELEEPSYRKFVHYILSRILFYQGQFGPALKEIQKYIEFEPGTGFGHSGLASVYAALGEREKAQLELEKTFKHPFWDEDIIENLISAFVFLGDKEKVYEWIEKGMEQNKVEWVFLANNPFLAEFRKEKRFQELVSELKSKTMAG